MRGIGTGIGLLTILLGLTGCHKTDAQLRPPKQPEELVAPPDETRFLQPPTYSKMPPSDGTESTRPGLGTPSGASRTGSMRGGLNQ